MKARLDNKASTANEKMYVAHRYQTTITVNNSGKFIPRGFDITEFYIPSLNLCFNEEAVFKSNKARNVTGLNTYRRTEAITTISLPSTLIDKLKLIFESHCADSSFKPFNELKNDKEIAELFKWMYLSVDEGNNSRFINVSLLEEEKHFEIAYKTCGNSALIPYMLNYVLHGRTVDNTTIDRILNIIQSLDQDEKNSIKNSFLDHINNYASKQGNQSSDTHTSAAALGSGLATFAVTKNPILSLGVGAIGGVATFFGANAYKKYHENQQSMLKQRFIDALDAPIKTLMKGNNK